MDQSKSSNGREEALSRKGQLALVGILLAAILGAYMSSMTFVGAIVLSDVTLEDVEGFTIFADKITITGGPPTMIMAEGTMDGMTVVAQNASRTEIVNMRLVKDGLEITADRAIGTDVFMKITKVVAGNATFTDMEIIAIPEFKQIAYGEVTLEDVEITAVYQFAEKMTMYGMKLTIS